jgi:hypothetical protein
MAIPKGHGHIQKPDSSGHGKRPKPLTMLALSYTVTILTSRYDSVAIFKSMLMVAYMEFPPEIETARKQHPDELIDLADNFVKTDLCIKELVRVYRVKRLIQADHENMVNFRRHC